MSTARTLGSASLALLAALAACGGDARRADSTADSAVAPPDTSTTFTPGGDSALLPRTDSARTDSARAAAAVPVLLLAADSASGDSLYENSAGRCRACHGPKGAGLASLGPSLRDSVWLDTDGSVAGIMQVIRDGVAEPRGGSSRMPALGRQLDRDQIAKIAVYVYSLTHPGALAGDSASARSVPGLSDS